MKMGFNRIRNRAGSMEMRKLVIKSSLRDNDDLLARALKKD